MAQVGLAAGLSFIPVVGPFASALGGLLGAQLDRKLGLYGKPEPLRAPDVQVTLASEGTPGTYVYGLHVRIPLHFVWHSSFVATGRTGTNKRGLAQPTTVWGNFVCVAGFHYLGPITQILAEGKRIWTADPDLDLTPVARAARVDASAGVYAFYSRFAFLGIGIPLEITIENTRDGSGNPIAGSPDLSVYDVGGSVNILLDGLYYDGSATHTTQYRFAVLEARVVDSNGNSKLRVRSTGRIASGAGWSTKVTGNVVNAGVVVTIDGLLVATDPRVFPNGNTPSRFIETTKSALLVAYNGAGETSRYPKVELIDLADMSLASFGNRPPQVECIAAGYDDSGTGGRDRTLLADSIEDLLVVHAGLEVTDVDLEFDPGIELGGLAITGPFQPADPIQSLLVANDLVWQEGSGGDFRAFARIIEGIDRDTVTIEADSLNVSVGGRGWEEEDVQSKRVETRERVKRATIGFSNYEHSLMRGEESESLDALPHGQELTLELIALTMTPTAAKRIARRLLRESAVRIAKAKVLVGWETYELQTDDVLPFTDRFGDAWVMLVDRIAENAEFVYEVEGYVVAEVPAAAPAGTGAPESGSRAGDSGNDPKARGACPLTFVAVECRPLADDHSSRVGFYIGAAPAGDGVAYEGATVWIRRDGDAWLEIGQLPKAATIGYVATATASGTTTGYDVTTEIDVEIRHETPAGTTEALCDLGRNLAAVGAEVVGFTSVTTVDAENYTLDNLSRGRCDTAAAVGTHADGESFLLLDDAVAFVPLAIEDLGTDIEIAVTAPGASVDDVLPETLTIQGLSVLPLELDSVGLASAGDALVVTWTYRSLRSSRFRVPTTEPVEPGETVLLQFWNTTVAGITGSPVHEVEVHAAPGTYRIESPGDFGVIGTTVAVRAKVRSSLIGLVSTPAEDDVSATFALPIDPGDFDPTGTAADAVSAHEFLADPHTQYQRESEKDAASGYAGLDANARLPSNKVQFSATDKVLCRSTSGAGAGEESTLTETGRVLIAATSIVNLRQRIGLWRVFEDFTKTLTAAGISTSLGGSGSAYISPMGYHAHHRTSDVQGILQVTCGSGSAATDIGCAYHTNAGLYLSDGAEFVFRVSTTSATNLLLRFGLRSDAPTTGADVVNGGYFEVDTTVSSNWYGCTAAASTRTKTSTGYGVSNTNVTWQWVRIKFVSGGTGMIFSHYAAGAWVDDLTIATNIPTSGVNRQVRVFAQSIGNGGTYRDIHIDCYGAPVTSPPPVPTA